jgi:SEC-C motif
MLSRNDPCPCGGGKKYKRCCLVRLDELDRQPRQRDALMDDVITWLRAEHEQTVHDATAHTGLLPYPITCSHHSRSRRPVRVLCLLKSSRDFEY